jgi:hypothetical protein
LNVPGSAEFFLAFLAAAFLSALLFHSASFAFPFASFAFPQWISGALSRMPPFAVVLLPQLAVLGIAPSLPLPPLSPHCCLHHSLYNEVM